MKIIIGEPFTIVLHITVIVKNTNIIERFLTFEDKTYYTHTAYNIVNDNVNFNKNIFSVEM